MSSQTVSRYDFTLILEARWAQEDIFAASWDGATLGALSGLSGALLCLALIRRREDERHIPCAACEPGPTQPPEARERFARLAKPG